MSRLAAAAGVLAVLLACPPAEACEAASLYRLFPLGVAGDHLVALELDLRRSSEHDDLPWKGELAIVELSDGGDVVAERWRGAIPRWRSSSGGDAATALFREAWEMGSVDELKPLPPPDVTLCAFGTRCAGLALKTKGAGTLLHAEGEPGPRAIPLLPRAMRQFAHWWSDPGDSEELRASKAVAYVREHLPGLRFSSVRRYELGGKPLYVVNLTTGTLRFISPDDKPRALPAKPCPGPTPCLYDEPTLHHGEAFDIVLR